MVTRRSVIQRAGLALFLGALVAAGCSVDAKSDDARSQSRATELVTALQADGLAPRLTVDVAAALYGADAAGVCDVFEDGLNSNEYLLLLGNPANRRRKMITTDSVSYMRVVVATYCPARQLEFEDVVANLDSVDTTR